MSDTSAPDALGDLPPSCALVYRILDEDGPMRPTEIRETGYLSERTCYDALETLEDEGLVERRSGPYGRTTVYECSLNSNSADTSCE